uniref:Uncharacterized protein n=1 Tax=Alexandrium catenella TaxID=2925 RepID=A0A7S1W664_ALECA|mmetsp:Transcript_40713/g.110061  ORF Transcript_40713/g.110061 Transcript_40713/m.110061 type:complete len:148 (+) Transcript_40713:54-497(+)
MQLAWTQIDKKLDQTFYAVELAVTAVMVTNIFQYAWWRCRERQGELTHWQRWDAAYYLAASIPLNVAFPFAVVLIYIGEVNYPASKMWHSGSWFPNTVHGGLLYAGKWFGVGLLTVGVFKATRLHARILEKWRALRGKGAVSHSSDP